jgi:hypothetical protein
MAGSATLLHMKKSSRGNQDQGGNPENFGCRMPNAARGWGVQGQERPLPALYLEALYDMIALADGARARAASILFVWS